MNDFYTGIDLGTDSIKIIVCEKIGDKYNVLSKTSHPSSGIERGFISDIKSATNSVKSAIEEVNNILGIEINKVIASVPPEGCKFDILSGDCDVDDYNEISGKDVSNVLLSALKNHDFEDYELVYCNAN